MARSDGPFEVIAKIGDNAYKLQLPGDMAVSATFNVGDLSPYVEDSVEDPSDLETNPLEDGEGDAGACDPNQTEKAQDQTDQDQGAILALFSLSSSRAFAVLDDPFGRPNQVMIGRVLLCWTP
uniref:Tf2-1-like SH3-like domain-containing protein n=1 Tax=Opuntia streptacantha TaxID=393608 RepID=A0A7C8Z7B4_OPUST